MRSLCAAVLLAATLPLGLSAPPARAAPVGDRLILQPETGASFTVEGYPKGPGPCPRTPRQPLRAIYEGRLEVVRDGSGALKLIDTLDFPSYLAGLAEVPLSWPDAALRAQVIAARTYAIDAIERGADRAARRGYDICASDQCQVFRGATVARGAFGERWLAAVAATRGKVLTRAGKVVQTFYFSTSDGRTRRSFPGGTPQAYLRSVDGEDADAPLARWTVRIPFADLGRILRAAGYRAASTVRSVVARADGIRVGGPGGATTLSKKELRSAMNTHSPCVLPSRYPTPGASKGSKLPQAVPSLTYRAAVSGSTLVLQGRGWGHGVGMSQWGARSLAARGRTAAQILTHYYDARLTTITEPDEIRVLAAEGLTRVVITVDGAATITSGTGSALAPGTTFEVAGGDVMTIRRATTGTFASVLQVTPLVADLVVEPAGTIEVPYELSRAARVTVTVIGPDGARIEAAPEASRERGDQRAVLPLTAGWAAGLAPGSYQVEIEAYDGLDRIRSVPVAVTIAAPSPSPTPAPVGVPADRWPLIAAAAGFLALATGGTLFHRVRTRRRARTTPQS